MNKNTVISSLEEPALIIEIKAGLLQRIQAFILNRITLPFIWFRVRQ